jgi:hypothetical protein
LPTIEGLKNLDMEEFIEKYEKYLKSL